MRYNEVRDSPTVVYILECSGELNLSMCRAMEKMYLNETSNRAVLQQTGSIILELATSSFESALFNQFISSFLEALTRVDKGHHPFFSSFCLLIYH